MASRSLRPALGNPQEERLFSMSFSKGQEIELNCNGLGHLPKKMRFGSHVYSWKCVGINFNTRGLKVEE